MHHSGPPSFFGACRYRTGVTEARNGDRQVGEGGGYRGKKAFRTRNTIQEPCRSHRFTDKGHKKK